MDKQVEIIADKIYSMHLESVGIAIEREIKKDMGIFSFLFPSKYFRSIILRFNK